MKAIRRIIIEDWRYWLRSRMAFSIFSLAMLLTVSSVVVTTLDMRQKNQDRVHLQQNSESRFLEQPDRHPHRMIHYGHYLFRSAAPLSILEPGVDPYTGTSIFLEGHRQNSATFADLQKSSGLSRFSNLSPSFIAQLIGPLFIFLMGYSSVSREKQSGTLAMMISHGISRWDILIGKFLALVSCSALLLIPVAIAGVWVSLEAESSIITISFLLGYLVYFGIWSALTVGVSSLSPHNHGSFVSMVGLWLVFCLLLPRIGSSTAAALDPSPSKLESDFAVLHELRKLGDGHNSSDPAFAKLRTNLLRKYNVERVEDLPVNFRGVVAQSSEEQQSQVLNKFAGQRMDRELSQAQIARNFGWLSPAIAIRSFAMVIAGTGIETHHRFLREAEIVRYDFVQSLNQVHQHKLNYTTDINRSKDAASSRAARVDASNWKVLSSFSFATEPWLTRLNRTLPYCLQLLGWCLMASILLRRSRMELV